MTKTYTAEEAKKILGDAKNHTVVEQGGKKYLDGIEIVGKSDAQGKTLTDPEEKKSFFKKAFKKQAD